MTALSRAQVVPCGLPRPRTLSPTAAHTQLALNSKPTPATASDALIDSHSQQLNLISRALHRYRHYATALGRELALLLLCHGSSALAALVRLSYRIAYILCAYLQQWAARSGVPSAAAIAAAHALRSLGAAVRQHVVRPLGRLLSQLVWVQVALSTDDVLDEDTHVSARVNSCVSLLFGTIRFRTHSCLQLATPSRQPLLAPEVSLTSPTASPTRRTQQQQRRRQLQRSRSSSPSPHSSPRPRLNHPAATAASDSACAAADGDSGGAGRQHMAAPRMQQPLQSQEPRGSVARALRFSSLRQAQQGLASSVAADSEVHVLCSSELQAAILAFLQAHSRRSGSEFVLLRNFSSSSSAPLSPATQQVVEAPELAPGAAAQADEAAAAAAVAGLCADVAGAGQTAGVCAGSEAQPTTAAPLVWAADDSSSVASSTTDSWPDEATGCQGSLAQPQPQQQEQEQEQQEVQQQPHQLLGFHQPGLSHPLPLAQAWDQLDMQQGRQQQVVAGVSSDHVSDTNYSADAGSAQQSHTTSLLAAAADVLTGEQLPDSPKKSDSSPHKHHLLATRPSPSSTAAAKAAAAAAAAGGACSISSGTTSDSSSNAVRPRALQESGSFASAADKFRALAASAAAASADADTDLCSRPLMAFSPKGSASPPRSSLRRSGSSKALLSGSSLHQQQQYALLFPPGSRSFEALSLRKSGGRSPIGTPACHARNDVVKKKLPAVPFSLSAASSPLPSPSGMWQEPC